MRIHTFWYDKERLGITTKSKSKIISTPKHSSHDIENVNTSVDLPILNPLTEILPFPVSTTSESDEQDFTTKLNAFEVRKINRFIIAHINTNSIRNKTDLLAEGVRWYIDIGDIFLQFQRLRLMTLFLQVNLLLVVLLHHLDVTEQIKKGYTCICNRTYSL